MLFMVIKHFKDPDSAPAHERFAKRARMTPRALDVGVDRCFQVMETSDPILFQEWIKN
jgi:hypothetical protein